MNSPVILKICFELSSKEIANKSLVTLATSMLVTNVGDKMKR